MYTVHPLAEFFPMMPDAELDAMAASIKSKGLTEPIAILKGTKTIVDGRNRRAACIRADVEPTYQEVDIHPEDLIDFIERKNVFRRHLNASQRAMIAAAMVDERLKHNHQQTPKNDSPEVLAKFSQNSTPQKQPKNKGGRPAVGASKAVRDEAKKSKVSEAQVKKARAVKAASPEIAKQVVDGEKTLNAAAKEIKERQESESSPAESDTGKKLDGEKHEIPDDLLSDWDLANDVIKDAVDHLKKAEESLIKLFEHKSGGWLRGDDQFEKIYEKDKPKIHAKKIRNIRILLSRMAPHAVCQFCGGKGGKACKFKHETSIAPVYPCRECGWMTKAGFDTVKKLNLHKAS